MVHKEKYQSIADNTAKSLDGYALHIGKIGEDTFVYSLRTSDSRQYNPKDQTIITVTDDDAKVYISEESDEILKKTTLREFSTGRAIYKKYVLMVKNQSFIIGEGLDYAKAIVKAVESKAIKSSLMYQYLEIAEHNHLKIKISEDENRDAYIILY